MWLSSLFYFKTSQLSLSYRTREIFGGIKYWRIQISLTFGWQNIGELTFLQAIWMVKLRHLEVTNSPIFSPSKYFPCTVYYQSHILCTYIGSPNVTDLELKVRICKTFYVIIKILLCCYMLTVVCLLVSRFFADASSLCNHSQSPSVSGYFT